LIKIRTPARSETAKAAVGLSDELTAGFSDELKIDTKSYVPREDIQQVRSPTGSTGIPLLMRGLPLLSSRARLGSSGSSAT
jgi:hypothetical protein